VDTKIKKMVRTGIMHFLSAFDKRKRLGCPRKKPENPSPSTGEVRVGVGSKWPNDRINGESDEII
jgi:hypothetical protein